MRIVPAIAALFTAAGLLPAQEGSGWVVVQGGAAASTSGGVLKAGTIVGLGVGGWFTDHWGAEVSILDTQVKLKATERKGQETHGAVSALFNFNPGGTRLVPFARLGLGVIANRGDLKDLEGDRRASAHAGVGLQAGFGGPLLGSAEFRWTRIGRNDPRHNEAAWLLGVGYRWGGSASGGKGLPATSGPAPLPRPLVEALPPSPQAPGVEVVPQRPQGPGAEALPPPSNPPPPVILLP